MKYLIVITCVLISFTGFARKWNATELPQPRQYDSNNWVSNPDNILSAIAVAQINAMLGEINRTTGAQVAVAVIDDINAPDIDSFATNLFNAWGVGEKGANNGVLLVIAKDARQYAFRTGRGIGSVITDVETARIGRNLLAPNFRNEDYDRGTLLAVNELMERMTTEEAIDEIKEASSRAKEEDGQSLMDVVLFYLWCCIGLTAVLAVWVIVRVRGTSKVERHLRYVELHPMLRIIYGLGFVGLGIPFLVYLPFKQFVRNLRDGEHLCPNCHAKMHKLDEIQDNEHLTPSQDAEERFNSVDYDVWECPNCGEEDVYAFENKESGLVECPHCHAKTARYLRDRIIKLPTEKSEGLAVKEFTCLNCNKQSQIPFKLPKQPSVAKTAASAIPFIFLGGMGRGGGGGFGGGGFGGGTTGGGGSSGGW